MWAYLAYLLYQSPFSDIRQMSPGLVSMCRFSWLRLERRSALGDFWELPHLQPPDSYAFTGLFSLLPPPVSAFTASYYPGDSRWPLQMFRALPQHGPLLAWTLPCRCFRFSKLGALCPPLRETVMLCHAETQGFCTTCFFVSLPRCYYI